MQANKSCYHSLAEPTSSVLINPALHFRDERFDICSSWFKVKQATQTKNEIKEYDTSNLILVNF